MIRIIASVMSVVRRGLAKLLAMPIHLYRYAISPMLPPSCRFYPTCSEYALQALREHGPLGGSWLAVRRICRCHPWNNGGLDPVPDKFAPSTYSRTAFLASLSRWPAAQRGKPPARTD